MTTRHMNVVSGLLLLLVPVFAVAGPFPSTAPAGPDTGRRIQDDTPLPPLSVPAGGKPLKEVLSDVRRVVPTFNYVLVHARDIPDGEPSLPQFNLTGTTIGQFLQFVITECPMVRISKVDPSGGRPALFVINVEHPAQAATEPADQEIVIDSLARLVLARAKAKGAGDHIREATDEVLSVVQTALDVANLPGPPMTIKVHPATLTLILSGTKAQVRLVDKTLLAISRAEDEQPTAANGHRSDPVQLQAELDFLREQLKQARQELATRPTTRRTLLPAE